MVYFVSLLRRQGADDAVGNIADVNVIPRLAAVAIDRNVHVTGSPFGKYVDNASFAADFGPFAVDVGKAQDDVIQSIPLVIQAQVRFDRRLAQAVKGQGRQPIVFRQGQILFRRIAVHGCRRGEDNALHAGLAGAFQHVDRTHDVVPRIAVGVLDGYVDAGLGRQVDDALKPPSIHDVQQHRAVDIQADKAGSFRYVRPQAAAQVVDDEDVVPHR